MFSDHSGAAAPGNSPGIDSTRDLCKLKADKIPTERRDVSIKSHL